MIMNKLGYVTTTPDTLQKAFGKPELLNGDTSLWYEAKFYNDGEPIRAYVYLLNDANAIPRHNELFKFSVGGDTDALDYVYQAIEKAKEL
tara:strand:- start:2040 stop:2309 length:270 start_codon:yes stop_codon:yes gene_type:complete